MTEFRVVKPIWSDRVTVYARQLIDGRYKSLVCDGIKYVDQPEGDESPPFFSFHAWGSCAQSLFDALWDAGFRPNNGESSQAHVNAMGAHLRDLQRIVFKESVGDD